MESPGGLVKAEIRGDIPIAYLQYPSIRRQISLHKTRKNYVAGHKKEDTPKTTMAKSSTGSKREDSTGRALKPKMAKAGSWSKTTKTQEQASTSAETNPPKSVTGITRDRRE